MIRLIQIRVCNGNENPIEVLDLDKTFQTMIEFKKEKENLNNYYKIKYSKKEINIDCTYMEK